MWKTPTDSTRRQECYCSKMIDWLISWARWSDGWGRVYAKIGLHCLLPWQVGGWRWDFELGCVLFSKRHTSIWPADSLFNILMYGPKKLININSWRKDEKKRVVTFFSIPYCILGKRHGGCRSAARSCSPTYQLLFRKIHSHALLLVVPFAECFIR